MPFRNLSVAPYTASLIPRPAQPYVLITFDDTLITDYTVAYPRIASRGLVATCYAPTNYLGADADHMSLAQAQELYAAGWDIGNHSKSHAALNTLSQAQVEFELLGATNILINAGFTRSARHVAYPYGQHADHVLAAMAATGMLTGRTTEINQFTNEVNKYDIPALTIDRAVAVATATNFINVAKQHGGLAAVLFHGIVASNPNIYQCTIATFEAILDYIVSNVGVLTISQLYNQYMTVQA